MENKQAFPLDWPHGQPRTPVHARKSARFKTRQDWAQTQLVEEIRRLKGRDVVLSTNIAVRRDGLPYAGRAAPADPGVAVYFELNGRTQCFACDKWDTVRDNIVAIFKTIEALRGIERWGSGDMVERAFSGFTALPAPVETRLWWQVLGVDENATLEEINLAYRNIAKRINNEGNKADTEKRMVELNQAVNFARRLRK